MWRDVPGETGELALIHKAAQGDHEAFRSIVLLYEARLIRYLTQMLGGDVDSAYDIAQDTFIAIFQNLPHWQVPHATVILTDNAYSDRQSASSAEDSQLLSPWLYRIATNRALSLLRKQAVRSKVQRYSHDHLPAVHDDSVQETLSISWQPSFEDSSIARELLRNALATLATDDAACLVLHYVSGERYSEIATRLGISSEAVRKRVARALIALRKAYVVLDTEVR